MKKLSPELAQKYTEIISKVQAKGYEVNEENLRNIAKEMGNEAFLEQIEQELRPNRKAPKITPAEIKAILIKFFIVFVVVFAAIYMLISYYTPIITTSILDHSIFHTTFTDEKGSTTWLIYGRYEQTPNIVLIDGQNKKLIKEVISDIVSPKARIINNLVYIFDDNTRFEARDSHTGEIVLDNELLAKKNPALKSGIDSVRYNTPWLNIVTKKGEKFYYHLQTSKLYNAKKKKNLVENYKDNNFTKFIWGIPQSSIKEKLIVLISRETNFYGESEYTRMYGSIISTPNWERLQKNEKMYSNEKLIFTPEKMFLNPQIIYADSAYCVVRHNTEIGKNENPIVTCISAKEKKILWEIPNKNVKKSNLLTNLTYRQIPLLSSNRYKNLLNISSANYQLDNKPADNHFFPIFCQIDLQTGKTLWECTPNF